MKFGRQFVEAVFAAANSLRAEDLPYDGSQSIKAKIDSLGDSGDPYNVFNGYGRRLGRMEGRGVTSDTMDEQGAARPATYVDVSASHVNGFGGGYFRQSGASITLLTGSGWFPGSSAKIEALARIVWIPSAVPSDYRYFCGWGNGYVVADDPLGFYAGVQLSTFRGDTTWQFISRDNAAQEITDTLITPSAFTSYFFKIECSTGSTSLRVYNGLTFAQIGSTITHTTRTPAGSLAFRQHMDTSGASVDVGMAHLSLVGDH